MARKYLDDTGLTRLWSKITDKVTAVQAMLNSAVSTLSDAIAAKVSKSGDTMTGNLKLEGSSQPSVLFKESGYGDKFEIKPSFGGTDEANYLAIKTATGAAGTDPATTEKIRIYPSGTIKVTGDRGGSWVSSKDTHQSAIEVDGTATAGTRYDSIISMKCNNGNTINLGRITNEFHIGYVESSQTANNLRKSVKFAPADDKVSLMENGAETLSLVNSTGSVYGYGSQFVTDKNMPVSPSSGSLYGVGHYLRDASGANMAYFRTHSSNAEKGLQLEATRTINGTAYYNTLNMRINASGGKTIVVSDPGAWRTALGLGTMATQNTGSWQPAWANNTLYNIGDDVKIGDQNVGGTLVVQGANADGDVQIRTQNGSVITSIRSIYNKQLTSAVAFTRSHASVSYTEGLVCNRCCNVVTFAGYFSCGATIGANVVLYSGLPKPAGGKSIYFTWSGYDFYLHPTDGTIRTNGQIVSRTYVGTFTYVCA